MMETILEKFDELEAALKGRQENQLKRLRDGVKQLRFDFIKYSESRTWWARFKRFLKEVFYG